MCKTTIFIRFQSLRIFIQFQAFDCVIEIFERHALTLVSPVNPGHSDGMILHTWGFCEHTDLVVAELTIQEGLYKIL